MSVTVDINGMVKHRVDVVNCGPPPGVKDDDPLGPRRYRWVHRRGTDILESGELIHWRSDGAAALAGSVLRQLAVELREL